MAASATNPTAATGSRTSVSTANDVTAPTGTDFFRNE